MFLQDKQTGTLVEILDTAALADPVENKISGRIQAGQEEQPPEQFAKDMLIFPSGESLPRCWIDANYRESQPPSP
jgi:hypothetical protein